MIRPSPDIVLIEDNAYDTELAFRAFRKKNLGEKIIHLADGGAAIQHFTNIGSILPGLIVLDLNMPIISGFEILKFIKTHNRLRVVPVIILTTSNQETDINRCYELGANAYVVKPVDFETFVTAIDDIRTFWITRNQFPVA